MARSSAFALPTEEQTLVSVQDMTGGLDRRVAPSLMKPERARQALNCRLSVPGVFTPRPGWNTFLDTSLGAGRIQGGERVYLEDVDPFTLIAFSGSVYKPSDDGTLNAAVLAGRNASNAILFPFDSDIVAVFDGANVPHKSVDGSTWTQMGIDAPTVAPTAAAIAGGSLIDGNTYEFSYAYQDDALSHYGNESATVQQAVAGANLSVRVTITGTGDAQVDTVLVFARNVTAGETVRRLAGGVANPGAATTATLDITENDWTLQEEAPTRRNVPPALAFGVVWKNRWWARHATLETRIHFTEIFENQSWPTLYYIDIPFTQGDGITAIVPVGDVLVVYGSGQQAFLIIGQTSLDFEVRPSAAVEAGCFGPRGWARVENGVVHAAAEGVYLFDGANDRLLSYDIEEDWREMAQQATSGDLDKVAVVYHRRDKEVRVAAPTLAIYGTPGEYVMDLARTRVKNVPAWSMTNRSIGGYLTWDGPESTTGNRGRLFSWGYSVGLLYEESTGTSADGANQTCEYEGPQFATGQRIARFTELYGEYQPSAGTLTVEVKVDGLSVGTFTPTISGGLSVYGDALYGTGTYGSAARKLWSIPMPLAAQGRVFSVKLSYQGTASPEFYTLAMVVKPEPEIRGIN